MNSFDLYIVSFFNKFNHCSLILNKIINVVETSDLLTIVPLTSLLWWVWFSNDENQKFSNRKFVVSTVVACFFVGLFCYFIEHAQFLLVFKPRPRCDPGINFSVPLGIDPATQDFCNYSHSTFPSGHAALLFAVSVGLLYTSRICGVLCLIYSFIMCLPRMYIGDHYATDIIGGALIAAPIVFLANMKWAEKSITNPILKWSDRHPPSFYVIFFIMSFNIITYYSDVGRILKAIFMLLKHFLH